MDVTRARKLLTEVALDDEGSFYGPAAGLSLGRGLIISGVEFPVFDANQDRFKVQSGTVYVLSHECDLDANNARFLNGVALICPLIPLEAIIDEATETSLPDDELGAFLGNVARRRIARSVYCPPLPPIAVYGGLLNLNLLSSTSVSRLAAGQPLAAVTAHAHQTILTALGEHLLRDKSERLPLTDALVRRSRSILCN